MIRKLERSSLLLAAIGTAMVWILPFLLEGSNAPEWLLSRWYLLVGAPALLFGVFAFQRYGGFAHAPAVVCYSALITVGCLWTDQSEEGRALLIAVAFVMVLPIAALIRKQDFLESFLVSYALASTATMLFALAMTGSLTLKDSVGTTTTNTNGIGIQAALSALFLLMFFPQGKGWRRILCACCVVFLVICAIDTASRTAFVAMGGSMLIALFFLSRKSAVQISILLTIAGLGAVGVSEVLDLDTRFYQGIQSRLLEDEEGTRGTLGDRVQIWDVAVVAFLSDTNWLHGTGTGGVDKALGSLYESKGRAKGRDGIWRLHAHNTLVWSGVAMGIPGILVLIWMGLSMLIAAYRLDQQFKSWEHLTLASFAGITSFGGVLTQDGCWCVLGGALLCGLSAPLQSTAIATQYVFCPEELKKHRGGQIGPEPEWM